MFWALLWKWSQNWRLVNKASCIGVGILFAMRKGRLRKKKKLLKAAECEAAKGRQVDRFIKLKSEVVDQLCLDEKMW